jgi:hypothetical protein
MSIYIADNDLGISSQALAILAMLSRTDCDGLAKYGDGQYQIAIRTWAWYNGRERGVCLEVRPSLGSKRALLVTFGEHRNTDGIFIDAWEVEEYFLSPPTVADYTEEAYEQRVFAPYGNVARAIEIIRGKITAFMESVSEEVVPTEIPAVASVPARVLPELGEET